MQLTLCDRHSLDSNLGTIWSHWGGVLFHAIVLINNLPPGCYSNTSSSIPSWETLQYWPFFPALQLFSCSQRNSNSRDSCCGPPALCSSYCSNGSLLTAMHSMTFLMFKFRRVLKEIWNNLLVLVSKLLYMNKFFNEGFIILCICEFSRLYKKH